LKRDRRTTGRANSRRALDDTNTAITINSTTIASQIDDRPAPVKNAMKGGNISIIEHVTARMR
jgi:hypothetical protein